MAKKIKAKPKRRMLLPTEFEVRDIQWAVGVKCQCGYELDLFTYHQSHEMVCKKCGRGYEIALRAYQVK